MSVNFWTWASPRCLSSLLLTDEGAQTWCSCVPFRTEAGNPHSWEPETFYHNSPDKSITKSPRTPHINFDWLIIDYLIAFASFPNLRTNKTDVFISEIICCQFSNIFLHLTHFLKDFFVNLTLKVIEYEVANAIRTHPGPVVKLVRLFVTVFFLLLSWFR